MVPASGTDATAHTSAAAADGTQSLTAARLQREKRRRQSEPRGGEDEPARCGLVAEHRPSGVEAALEAALRASGQRRREERHGGERERGRAQEQR